MMQDTRTADRSDLLIAGAAVVGLLVSWTIGASSDQHLLALPVALGFAGPLAVRRRHPMAALLCSAATASLQAISSQAVIAIPFAPASRSILPVLVLLTLAYSAGALLDTAPSCLCVASAWAMLLAGSYLPGGGGGSADPAGIAQSLLYTGIMIVPGWIAGRLVQRHWQQAETLRRLTSSAVADHDRRLADAVAAERARIGTELQDIIAHAVSVMVVQASGARLILQSDPQRARASIVHVERTGRESLQDLRRLVGLLRAQAQEDSAPLAPAGLHEIPHLLDALRLTGLMCDAQLGDPYDVPMGVDLLAYRLIEVVLRTAAAEGVSHARLTIDHAPRDLTITISADAAVPDLERALASLGPRVRAYDGKLVIDSRPDGFEITAQLPLHTAVPV